MFNRGGRCEWCWGRGRYEEGGVSVQERQEPSEQDQGEVIVVLSCTSGRGVGCGFCSPPGAVE